MENSACQRSPHGNGSACRYTDHVRGVCAVQVKSGAASIEFESTTVCSFTEDPTQNAYVLYDGHIVGISDAPTLKADPKPLDSGANKVELNR